MAKKDKTPTGQGTKAAEAPKMGRLAQMRQSYTVVKSVEPRIGLLLLGIFLGVAVVIAGLYILVGGNVVVAIVTGVLAGVLATLVFYGRRAPKAIMRSFKGEPGAPARALSLLRRGWKVEPFVAINKQRDAVTRVVGPPGIVLVGEGNPNRVRPLLTSERRRHERVAREVPIQEVVVGDDPGQVRLENLVKHVSKLPKKVKPAQMTEILDRLRAIDAGRPPIPMPKGPLPTSMRGARSQMRGR